MIKGRWWFLCIVIWLCLEKNINLTCQSQSIFKIFKKERLKHGIMRSLKCFCCVFLVASDQCSTITHLFPLKKRRLSNTNTANNRGTQRLSCHDVGKIFYLSAHAAVALIASWAVPPPPSVSPLLCTALSLPSSLSFLSLLQHLLFFRSLLSNTSSSSSLFRCLLRPPLCLCLDFCLAPRSKDALNWHCVWVSNPWKQRVPLATGESLCFAFIWQPLSPSKPDFCVRTGARGFRCPRGKVKLPWIMKHR